MELGKFVPPPNAEFEETLIPELGPNVVVLPDDAIPDC
jgi:hypothetical protein